MTVKKFLAEHPIAVLRDESISGVMVHPDREKWSSMPDKE